MKTSLMMRKRRRQRWKKGATRERTAIRRKSVGSFLGGGVNDALKKRGGRGCCPKEVCFTEGGERTYYHWRGERGKGGREGGLEHQLKKKKGALPSMSEGLRRRGKKKVAKDSEKKGRSGLPIAGGKRDGLTEPPKGKSALKAEEQKGTGKKTATQPLAKAESFFPIFKRGADSELKAKGHPAGGEKQRADPRRKVFV